MGAKVVETTQENNQDQRAFVEVWIYVGSYTIDNVKGDFFFQIFLYVRLKLTH